MTRIMYDSVNMGAIPTSATLVAFYVDGLYANGTACKARFPHAIRVPIAVFPSTNDGVVLDCETGDATPSQCPGWVVKRRAAGVDPTVYCSESVWPQVQAAFAANKVAQPHYWIAAYPGIGPQLYAGSIAHQYADPPGSGGNFDLSVVADYWPGVDSKTPIQPVSSIPNYIGYPTGRQFPNDFLTRMIQTQLRLLGYKGTATVPFKVDGVFGNQTALWVGLFQSRHALVSDGVVGALTWWSLFHADPTKWN